MAYLETLEHLAILSKKDPAVVEADPFAQLIMEKATELCVSTAAIPDGWELDGTLVPGRVRTICLFVAFRTYNNPNSVINSGVGPISESILAQHAAAMTLTDAEREELTQIGEANGQGGLWVMQTTAGPETIMDTQFLPDSSPTDWWIPYFANGDVGTEWDATTPPPPSGSTTYDGPTLAQFTALQTQVNTLAAAKADATYVNTQDAAIASTVATKADKTYVDSQDATKADKTYVDAQDATKADAATVDAELALKANEADLGAQIRVGTTPPPSGSGDLWADTTGA